MTSTPEPVKERTPWWRDVRRDAVLLIAITVLAVVAVAAAVLTTVDRTASRAEEARARAARTQAARAEAAAIEAEARARAAAHTSTTEPAPLVGGAPPVQGQSGAGRGRSAAAAATGRGREGAPGPGRATGPGDLPTAAPVPCPSSGVVVQPGGLDAAMGLRTMGLELINCGRRPYTVRGYPSVRVLGPDRTPLSVEIIQGRSAIAVLPPVDAPPVRVTLRPGERATAVLVWRTTAIAGPADRVTYVEVTGRPAEAPQTVTPTQELDIGTGGRLGVGPWTVDSAD